MHPRPVLLTVFDSTNSAPRDSVVLNPDRTILIGADQSADVVLSENPQAAPQHCSIEFDNGLCLIRDLDTEAGTSVNGQRVQRQELEEADVISVSGSRILVSFEIPETARTEVPGAPNSTTDTDWLRDAATQALREAGFTLYQELGRGTFARVFLATRNSDGEHVAIKVLDGVPADSPRMMQLFLRELDSLRELHHENIVRLHESGNLNDEVAWFAMDLVSGMTLRQLVFADGPLSVSDSCSITMQILRALHAAHTLSAPAGPLVHRDVKHDNVLVTGTPGNFHARLADFGLAKNFDRAGLSGVTKTGHVCGTLTFISPEQLRDSKYVGPEADVFSMGAVLYFCLTGHYLYRLLSNVRRSQLVQMVDSRQMVPVLERRPDLPQELADLIDCAVGTDEIRRFRTPGRFLNALEAVASRCT